MSAVSASADPVRVGIVGVRGYGATYPDAIAHSGLGRVVAVADADIDAARAAAAEHGVPAAYGDLSALLADPAVEAVFIATPHHMHHAHARDALLADRHVLCEKPLAIEPAHARELVALARTRGRVLSCHYNQRQTAPVMAMRELVAGGRLGGVYGAEARWLARWTGFLVDPRTSWRVDPARAGGGILIGRGSHLIDALLHVLGQPRVLSVSATTASRLTPHAIDDHAQVTLQLEGGSVASLCCSYLAHLGGRSEELAYEVLGDAGGASWRCVDGAVTHASAGRCELANGGWTEWGLEQGSSERTTVIADTLRAIRDGGDPMVTGEQAAKVVAIVDAAYRSAAAGTPVALG